MSLTKAGTKDYSHLTNMYEGKFPKVLIQLPMYNEDAHCDLIVQRCCKILWPNDKVLVQVNGFSNSIQCWLCQAGGSASVCRCCLLL